jgi:hypothetical protein
MVNFVWQGFFEIFCNGIWFCQIYWLSFIYKTDNIMANKKITQRQPGKVTAYEPVSHHIYHDGYSYRVRVIKNGTRYSQNFSSKKKAMDFRKSLLS